MTTTPHRGNRNCPAYYLGRPASFWLHALSRRPAESGAPPLPARRTSLATSTRTSL
jgi:hypothetical protein